MGTFERLRERIAAIPVIDCHEHTSGPVAAGKYADAVAALFQLYIGDDLRCVGTPDDLALISREGASLDEKWPAFERLWRRMEHTGYGHVTKRVARDVYDEPEITREALERINGRLLDLRDEATYRGILDRAGIRVRLVNIWVDPRKILNGEHKIYDRDRYFIALPGFHTVRNFQNIANHTQFIGRDVTSLDGYVDACRETFTRLKSAGAIGMKDQAAYGRTLHYEDPARAEAETLFNRIAEDPRRSLGWPEAKTLDDWLFHRFMEMARDLAFPVQLHTGGFGGLRNDVRRSDPALLVPILERYRDVRFALFHYGWPYAGSWLYLGKNYPNVALDTSWAGIADPAYAERTLAQAIGVVPHGKIHGFGGDYLDTPEFAVAHLEIARDNISAALARHVDSGWLDETEAVGIAADWLYNNPNRFYGLATEPVAI